jgi:hypothetical protein
MTDALGRFHAAAALLVATVHRCHILTGEPGWYSALGDDPPARHPVLNGEIPGSSRWRNHTSARRLRARRIAAACGAFRRRDGAVAGRG